MELNKMYSKLYFANITVENDWGYHLETLWYGTDPKNLALMIMDVMGSWYLPNKDQFSSDIVDFYEGLAEATKETEEGAESEMTPVTNLSFKDLSGEKFNANGLRLTVNTTNNLFDMYKFVADEAFVIFANKNENPEAFADLNEYIDYLDNTYDIDTSIMNALRNPNENTIASAIYLIDLKYKYSERYYKSQTN